MSDISILNHVLANWRTMPAWAKKHANDFLRLSYESHKRSLADVLSLSTEHDELKRRYRRAIGEIIKALMLIK